MKVELRSHTPDALNLLLETKNTRMKFDSNPADWTDEQRADHLAYMKDTIKSSWEMIDYVFRFSGVTRNFTHQLERTRSGSYAEQSLRASDVRDSEVKTPDSLTSPLASTVSRVVWHEAVDSAKHAYGTLVDNGVPIQDARGILPTNITTSLMAKFNLRTLHEMAKVRLCTRTQGEYQNAFREMRRLVIEAHPWVEQYEFLEVACVATGRCAFPRYGREKCKYHQPWMEVNVFQQSLLRADFWANPIQEANPVAREGKAV